MAESVNALVPVLDLAMVRGLEAFYEIESRSWKDPRGECSAISIQVARQFGLLYTEGKFRLDAPLQVGSQNVQEDHAWCIDGNKRIVDLTAEQFNNGLYNKIPKGLLIVKPEDALYLRYKPSRFVQNA